MCRMILIEGGFSSKEASSFVIAPDLTNLSWRLEVQKEMEE